jgi:taurine dioxygenase
VVGSDPENPGLVLIHKGSDTRAEQYENAFHCDTTWRECHVLSPHGASFGLSR